MKRILSTLLVLFSFMQISYSQWITQIPATSADLYDVKFVGRDLGWIVGEGVILRTQNGGVSWTVQEFPDFIFDECNFVDSNTGWAVGRTSEIEREKGLILKTEDGGDTWAVQDTSFSEFFWDGVYFVDPTHGWVAGGPLYDTTGTILRTTNGGNTWQPVGSGISEYLYDIFFIDRLNGWACGIRGGIYRTNDGGTNWERVFSLRQQIGYSLILRQVFFSTPDSGWVVGGIGGGTVIVSTTDGGDTWQYTLDFFFSYPYGLWFSDSKNGWVAGGALAGTRIARTSDGGLTWDVQPHGLGTQSISLNSVYMFDSQEGWIVGEDGTILKTMNGGVTLVAAEGNILPEFFQLHQNYPNPLNPSTTIRYEVPSRSHVILKIYNLLGQEVSTLIDEEKSPGRFTVQWDARNRFGQHVSSGVYLYRLVAGDFVQARKMLLLR